MFGYDDLREASEAAPNRATCPVRGCETEVSRMTGGAPKRLDKYLDTGETGGEDFERYLCAEHGIYITPSTFIYKDLWDNILWDDGTERDLLAEEVVAFALSVCRGIAVMVHVVEVAAGGRGGGIGCLLLAPVVVPPSGA